MCVLAAREIGDGDVVFVGIGLPTLACNLARATPAPNMTLIYESGAVGAVPDRVPPSIGDPALVTGSLMVTSMSDIFQSFLQNGKIQIGFLGGAQVDKHGNINTTSVGSYAAPKVRLPGSGGACEIAQHAQRVLIVTKLNKRAFPDKVDFITSNGKRVKKVITNMGILEPDDTGELMLTALYPGVTVESVQENIGWTLKTAARLAEVALPTTHEIELLRTKLDPNKIHIK
ncbi:MAG: 3-oxoadipate--succinyl-CoA transferase subunit B [Elusimicrobia bacterium CG11_big_fil_rev_8_21_14_0_20_64_6]|nr:MAG: 3-oxoadipate--succinyl-CoA transferase subunit B [Elusimicrobia bacterium CG11_big_fil_rev_8_21_14_0_20_64_6]